MKEQIMNTMIGKRADPKSKKLSALSFITVVTSSLCGFYVTRHQTATRLCKQKKPTRTKTEARDGLIHGESS